MNRGSVWFFELSIILMGFVLYESVYGTIRVCDSYFSWENCMMIDSDKFTVGRALSILAMIFFYAFSMGYILLVYDRPNKKIDFSLLICAGALFINSLCLSFYLLGERGAFLTFLSLGMLTVAFILKLAEDT